MTTANNAQITPADFPELKRLAWNRDPARPMDAREVFDLYDRNWRFVDRDHLTAKETELIQALERLFGNGFKLI